VPGSALQADNLFPQLWAMARVEPVMEALLDDIYVEYLDKLEKRFVEIGSSATRAEALARTSRMEVSALFVGRDRRCYAVCSATARQPASIAASR